MFEISKEQYFVCLSVNDPQKIFPPCLFLQFYILFWYILCYAHNFGCEVRRGRLYNVLPQDNTVLPLSAPFLM
jgi:hypothetical protein